jgi:hypothetical protein
MRGISIILLPGMVVEIVKKCGNKIPGLPEGAYNPWTDELDEELTDMFCRGININKMVDHFGRTKGAINARIKKLELMELYG